MIVQAPSGYLNPLYFTCFKQSLSLDLITCGDGNSLPPVHFDPFVLALTGFLGIMVMPVQSHFVRQNFFLEDPLKPNLNGINWAQKRPNKRVTMLMKIPSSLLRKKHESFILTHLIDSCCLH